jgi:ABC-2 type transport system ATP-binding protein
MTAPGGAITAVVGRNGQGKTTSLEVCEGLRVADSGQLRVLGIDPQADAALLRPRVGVMLQDGGVPRVARTVLSALAGLYANPRDPVELLDWLGLTAVNRQYRRLSGASSSVKLAAALIGRPELSFSMNRAPASIQNPVGECGH